MFMRIRLDADFEEFVRAHSGSLLRTAALLCGDAHRANDLLQLTLWRTHRHWGDALRNPDAYARKVLVNLAHDGRRHARRRVVETPLDEAILQGGGRRAGMRGGDRALPFEGGPFGERVTADEVTALVERDALLRALKRLAPRQRAVLVLRFWDDLSVDEAAAVLECSAGTVKSNTSKALANLRTILDAQSLPAPNARGSRDH
jgi:RNA polymerase sigma factor (sigma-70 family)